MNDGIIEVGGRTERWMGFNWNKQSFIALPACHHLAKLMVVHYHEELDHRGLQQRYLKSDRSIGSSESVGLLGN